MTYRMAETYTSYLTFPITETPVRGTSTSAVPYNSL